MLPTFCLTLLVAGAPAQGRVVFIGELEAAGETTAVQLATVRDAVLAELKAQGYDARVVGAPKADAAVGGAVTAQGRTFEITLKLKESGTARLLASTSVRCGAAEKLAEAAKEAAAQLASEGRLAWGVKAKFKPK